MRLVAINPAGGAAEPVTRQRDSAAALGPALAAVLWQLPRSVAKDSERLKEVLATLKLWSGVRHVMEFRHTSWFDTETAELLAAHDVALAISDAERWPLWDAVTTDLVYIRLHGRPRCYLSPYTEDALADWAARIRVWRSEGRAVQVHFDNTMEGAAVDNAVQLQTLLAEAPSSG